MDLGLKDKVIFITGGSTGIGAATALLFAQEGSKIVIADVNESDANVVVDKITTTGGQAIFVKCDVSKEDQIEGAIQKTIDRFGRLDFAFNNAGIEGVSAPLAEQTHESWDRVLAINLTGVFLCMKYQIPVMLKQGKGVIINCTSILGRVGFAGAPAYVASKHGVIGLTKNAALEYSAQGIRVNAIAPAFIETPMLDRAGLLSNPDTRKMIEALHPIGRLGTPDEIASAVAWLCSDGASFVTGHTVLADGGYIAR